VHRQTRSLLQELEMIGHNRDRAYIVESRANNIITSAINLLEMIHKHYDSEHAQLLERKLLSAIKNRDSEKFTKSIRKKPVDTP